jgi:hypothetical protein
LERRKEAGAGPEGDSLRRGRLGVLINEKKRFMFLVGFLSAL